MNCVPVLYVIYILYTVCTKLILPNYIIPRDVAPFFVVVKIPKNSRHLERKLIRYFLTLKGRC